MSDYLGKTVMKQYSNSATVLALLADFDQWMDLPRFSDQFLANVWDISTAQGFGLDIWGRILGQSRYIQIEQTPGNNFGFNINPVGGVINAINQEFGIGNGATTGFQLLGPDHRPATTSVSIASMTRQDWQGVQPLYATARTNYVQNSGNAALWSTNASPTVTANAAVAPDGTMTAALVSGTGNANCGVWKASTYTAAIGDTMTASVYVRFSSGAAQVRLRLEGAAFPALPNVTVNTQTGAVISSGGGTVVVTPMSGGGFRVSISAAATVAGGVNATMYAGTASAFANYLWGLQIEKSSTVTSYIGTAASAVTITDYSVNGTGFVTLAVAPQGPAAPVGGAAVLRWNGTYVGTIVGTQWQPWSQAPWYGGAAAGTTAFALQDEYYRQLLMVKAAANIARCDCPSINALMRSMFGSRGRCYVGYDPANPMHIGYHFEFFPTSVEKSIIQSGLFPQPAGTTATYIYETLTYAPFGFAGANRGADPNVVTGWSQHPFYQP
jgi:hypothetical protein